MTEDRLPLAELLAKAGDGDFLRSVAEAVVQLLMETDVEGVIGAGRHERSGERTTYRNGYRDRTLDTRVGSLQLRIPKLRQGSYFPPFLEPRKTSEKALVAVIQEAWVGGVSTRRVDDLRCDRSLVAPRFRRWGCPASARAPSASFARTSTTSGATAAWSHRSRCLPRPPACWRLAVSLARCNLPQAARGRAHRFGRGHNRCGSQHRGQAGGPAEGWPARDRGAAHRPERGRDLLGHLPQEPAPPRPARCEVGYLGRPRGPQGRNPSRDGRLLAALQGSLDAQRPVLRAQRPAKHGVGSSTFRISGGVAEGVRQSLQESDGEFDGLCARPRHG